MRFRGFHLDCYLDTSYLILCSSEGASGQQARQNLEERIRSGQELYSSAIALIQFMDAGKRAGLSDDSLLVLSDDFRQLVRELIPFGSHQWMEARALMADRGVSYSVACHAALALQEGLLLLSAQKDYRKIPGLLFSGPETV